PRAAWKDGQRSQRGRSAAVGADRPLTVAEKYYTFLDRASTTNVLITAEFDRWFPAEYVAAQWAEFRRRRVLARTVVTEDLRLRDSGDDVRPDTCFETRECPASDWDDVLGEQAAVR